jgi:hypothetical protein
LVAAIDLVTATERVTTAYEAALKVLKLSKGDDPIAEIIAKRIIEIAQTGVRDPANCARRP